MPPAHSHRVALWIAEIFGGPKLYSEQFGSALIMSQPGMKVPEKSPMPKWGWGEVKPFIPASDNKPDKNESNHS